MTHPALGGRIFHFAPKFRFASGLQTVTKWLHFATIFWDSASTLYNYSCMRNLQIYRCFFFFFFHVEKKWGRESDSAGLAGITLRCVALGAAATKKPSERTWGKTAESTWQSCNFRTIGHEGGKFSGGVFRPVPIGFPARKVGKRPLERSTVVVGVGGCQVTLTSTATPRFEHLKFASFFSK